MSTGTGHSDDRDRVRDATDLLDLVSAHVALKPRGREHVGLCPFHDDHKPSFAVVTHKGHAFYHCFACGASGDAFKFVMDYHKMDFPEALRFLADRAGVTLAGPGPRRSDDAPGTSRAGLRAACAYATDFFRSTLADPTAGAAARRVIAERGISEEMVERFQIGAAPAGYEGLVSRLGDRPSSRQVAATAGLLRERDRGGHYDTFRNRLVFPICDETGRPIAFGGRILDPDDNPKYLNSPETPIFQKSRTLYGLHLARRAIIDTGRAIVTEGYTDVIAAHQAGLAETVATLGTALTERHATLLGRLCDTVILVFDGDEAGRRAADRAVGLFMAAPVDIRICLLPEGVDPADLLQQEHGARRFGALLDDAVDVLEFKLERFRAVLPGHGGAAAQARVLESFLGELVELGFGAMPGVRRAPVLNRLSTLLEVPAPDLQREIERLARRAPRKRAATTVEAVPAEPTPTELPSDELTTAELLDADASRLIPRARRLAERELLGILLFEPDAGRAHVADDGRPFTELFRPDDFIDPAARRIASVVLPGLASAGAGLEAVMSRLTDSADLSTAAHLFRDGQRCCEGDGHAADADADADSALANATRTLRACIEREHLHREAARVRAQDDDSAEGLAARLELIRRRREHGDLPDAITQGVRA